jgi:hypothetical protein
VVNLIASIKEKTMRIIRVALLVMTLTCSVYAGEIPYGVTAADNIPNNVTTAGEIPYDITFVTLLRLILL